MHGMSDFDSLCFWSGSSAPVLFSLAAVVVSWDWRLRSMVWLFVGSFAASVVLGFKLVEYALHLPGNVGDHNPGWGIAFLPLVGGALAAVIVYGARHIVRALVRFS
jgi:hypothetical protein